MAHSCRTYNNSHTLEITIFSAIIHFMPEDIESRLSAIEETIEDNNIILRKLHRKETLSFWFGVIKIALFLGVSYYGYQLVQPYLEQLMELYASIKETADTAGEIKNNLNVGLNGFDLSKIIEGIKENQ